MFFFARRKTGLVGKVGGLLLAACGGGVVNLPAHAQRDPTVPPGVVGMPGAGATTAPAGLALEPGRIAVLQRGGVVYLVLGTRVYAQGQTVDGSKIERITETEVWLKDNGKVRKVAVFGGISRRAAPSDTPVRPGPSGISVLDWQPGPEFEL